MQARINPKYIVIHETDNFNKGAGAEAHSRAHNKGNLSYLSPIITLMM